MHWTGPYWDIMNLKYGLLSVIVGCHKGIAQGIATLDQSKRSFSLGVEKSFSLYFNEIARKFFIALAGICGLSAIFFGTGFFTSYFSSHVVSILYLTFSVLSILGCIWGLMAYREFTISAERVMRTRDLAKKIDPGIGNYDYKSYNPETHEFEEGYIPLGPIDFWDKETYAPAWLDKGKYWHVLTWSSDSRQGNCVQVSRDSELPLDCGRKNVAATMKRKPIALDSAIRTAEKVPL